MSDPLDALPEGRKQKYDSPDSPRSVGWTRPQRVRLADEANPLRLDCGIDFFPVDVEFETYGTLSPQKDNAVLIAHALSGDAHAAGWCADADADDRPWRKTRPGWWDPMIGPGKPFDTSKYFVICPNVLGSCYGTTGPGSVNPKTGKPYGLTFPVVTVGDWVRLQERLTASLGIEELLTVAGGSLGGQMAMEWALAYPGRIRSAIVLAATPHLMAQGLAFNYAGRHAIISDPNFKGGDYYGGPGPDQGLSVARMIGHITYLSDASMTTKFGRRLQENGSRGFRMDVEYQVESYLRHQGRAFVERFDPNAYLYITRAMDYYDASDHGGGDLTAAVAKARNDWLVISYSSDWLYPAAGSRELVKAITHNHQPVTYISLNSPYGHDAFLLETDRQSRMISDFLAKTALGPSRAARAASPAPAANDPLEPACSGVASAERWDHEMIKRIVPEGSSVLDLGCGGGTLLSYLFELKNVRGQGVEIDPGKAEKCVEKGVPVIQADLHEGLLAFFASGSFEYVILEKTLQAVNRPELVLQEMLRIGRIGIVSFPNFGHAEIRRYLSEEGRMPVTRVMPYEWHNTPNIRHLTILDFEDFCAKNAVHVLQRYAFSEGRIRPLQAEDNRLAEEALYVLCREDKRNAAASGP